MVLEPEKPRIKVPAGLVSDENAPLELQTAAFSLFPHRAERQ